MTDFSLILSFLTSLHKNNNREWFEKNKPTYVTAKCSFEDFLELLHSKILLFDPLLQNMNPRKAAFRIYRDVRFSKDKSPYKINMGAALSPAGRMEQEPGYYIHIEPGKSFIAAGLYQPDAEHLAKARQEIDYNSTDFKKIMSNASFKKAFGELKDFGKGKLPPKGYAKDHPQVEILKHKNFIVTHDLTDVDVKGQDFVKKATALCKQAKPFVDFFREALA